MSVRSYTPKRGALGFVSAHPLPTEQELSEYYSAKYYDTPNSSTYQTQYSDDELAHKRLRAKLAVHALAKASGGSLAEKSFFEVGYGEGFLLDAALAEGMTIAGVDFTDAGLERVHPQLRSHVATDNAYDHLEQLAQSGSKHDICVLQNVLEHVVDPDRMLNLLRNVLKEDGLLMINVPNDYSDLQMLALERGLIEREFWFSPVDHLHYFNTDNLPRYMESLGYRVEDLYGDFPIDIFLLNESANYVADRSKGKAAHNTRVTLDLLMARKGMDAYHRFCQAMSGVGIGRNVCVVARPK